MTAFSLKQNRKLNNKAEKKSEQKKHKKMMKVRRTAISANRIVGL